MKFLRDIIDKTRAVFIGNQSGTLAPIMHCLCADVLLIDCSGSMDTRMQDGNFQMTKREAATRAGMAFVERLPSEGYCAVFHYADTAVRSCALHPLANGKAPLQAALENPRAFGGTRTEYGLAAAFTELGRVSPNARRRVVLLTDGHSSDNSIQLARMMKEQGVQIDCIGVGNDPTEVNEEELRQIASIDNNGKPRYWFIRSSAALVERVEALALREFK